MNNAWNYKRQRAMNLNLIKLNFKIEFFCDEFVHAITMLPDKKMKSTLNSASLLSIKFEEHIGHLELTTDSENEDRETMNKDNNNSKNAVTMLVNKFSTTHLTYS